jgi:glycosyltransferase involved in cell wall biosynthesis
VLVEGPLGVWFKSVIPSLRLSRSRAQETWLLTSSNVGRVWGVDRVFSRLDSSAAASVYRSCDVLLKLSTIEGLPLPPLEMFHCGGTVVAFDVSGVGDYAVHGGNALLADRDDYEGVGAHLDELVADTGLVARLKEGAAKTAAAWPSEREAGLRFLSELESIVATHEPTTASTLERLREIPWPQAARSSNWQRLRRTRVAQSLYTSFEVLR